MDSTNNFDKVMDLIERAEKVMNACDESFQGMMRGGIINTSLGTPALLRNLKKANSIYKKLDKLTREGGDSYTPEQAQTIELKAKELTKRYDVYLKLVNQANEIAKGYVKSSGEAVVDAAKETITDAKDKVTDTFSGVFHKEDDDKEEAPGE